MSDLFTLHLIKQRILRHYRVMLTACADWDLDRAKVAQAFMDHELDTLCRRLRIGVTTNADCPTP